MTDFKGGKSGVVDAEPIDRWSDTADCATNDNRPYVSMIAVNNRVDSRYAVVYDARLW